MKNLNKAERRMKHIEQLAAIFNMPYADMKVVYHKLKTLESRGHRLAEDHCNGVDSESFDEKLDDIRKVLRSLLPDSDVKKNIHLNTDPRGYFLKIDDEFTRRNKLAIHTDWGGYGIICPSEE